MFIRLSGCLNRKRVGNLKAGIMHDTLEKALSQVTHHETQKYLIFLRKISAQGHFKIVTGEPSV